MSYKFVKHMILAVFCIFPPLLGAKQICVTDDADQQVCLEEPAQRIIALSPGHVELLFAAGGGDKAVAAVSHSDYPQQAKELPRVGSYNRLDIEAILAQRPDLVIGWISGNSPGQLKRLEELGMTVYRSEQRSIEDIAKSLERIGKLAGSAAEAAREAADLRARVAQLRQRYASREPVEVFYQVWQDPIITVNGKQLISESIRVCGGRNVFAHLDRLTPRLNVESVVAADPQAIVAGGMGEANDDWLNRWREYADMTAVKEDNLFFVPPSLLQRPTPRLLQGTAQLCRKLDQAR